MSGVLPALPSISAENELVVFSHKSLKGASPDFVDNERLAFLGNALYHASVTKYLYQRVPTGKIGYLDTLRSSFVMREYLVALSRAYRLPQRIQVAKYLSVDSLGNAQTDVFQAYIGAISLEHGIVALDNFVKSILDSIPSTDEVWTSSAGAPHPPLVSGVVAQENASENTAASVRQKENSLTQFPAESTSAPLRSQSTPPPYAPAARPSTPSDYGSLYAIPSVQASPTRSQQEPHQHPRQQSEPQQPPEQQRQYHREDDTGLVRIPAKRPLPAFDSPLRQPPKPPQATFAPTPVSASVPAQATATAPTPHPHAPPSPSHSSSSRVAGPSSTFQFDRMPIPHLSSPSRPYSPVDPFLDFSPGKKPIAAAFNGATSSVMSTSAPTKAYPSGTPLTSQSTSNHLNGASKPLPLVPATSNPPSAPAGPQLSSQGTTSKNGVDRKSYISQLHEAVTQRKEGNIDWEFDFSGPGHVMRWEARVKVNDRVVGAGAAPNKQIAKNIASRNALENLGWPFTE